MYIDIYISDWICKNMAIEISLVILTESRSGTHVCIYIFFSFLFLIYLISTEYLLNRLQYIDFDEFLTGYLSTKNFYISVTNLHSIVSLVLILCCVKQTTITVKMLGQVILTKTQIKSFFLHSRIFPTC